jgi:hypothetical protein
MTGGKMKKMQFHFLTKVRTIRELAEISGVPMIEIANTLGLSITMTHLKLKGARAIFLDECSALAQAMNQGGRLKVTESEIEALIGRENLKVRGFAG